MKSALLVIGRFVVPEEDFRIRIDRGILLMYVEDRDPLECLQEAAQRFRKTRTWPRVQTVVLAKQGDTARPGTDPAPGRGGPIPRADRCPAAARGRGLHPARRRHPPHPRAGV